MLCPLKEKEKTTRITYEDDYDINIYPETGELEMEESRWYSISRALQRVGGVSHICYHWEIYKLLFLLHNVNPVWMEVNITNGVVDFEKVFIIYVSSNLYTCHFS